MRRFWERSSSLSRREKSPSKAAARSSRNCSPKPTPAQNSPPGRIAEIIQEKGLEVVSDTGALEGIINAVVERNPKAVEDFQNGKQAAVGALIGQVMREVKGADAKVVRQMLIDRMNQ